MIFSSEIPVVNIKVLGLFSLLLLAIRLMEVAELCLVNCIIWLTKEEWPLGY